MDYTVISIIIIIILGYVYYSFRKLKLQNRLIQDQSKRISQINEILKIQNQKLIQLNLEKNQIIGVVSHDLKAPFNRLHALIGLIKMEDDPLDKNQMEQHMDKIQLVISEGLSLIRNLLDIRAIEDQGIDVKPEILSVPKEVSKLLRLYEPVADKKEIKLILCNDLSRPDIETDKQYLNRMVDNLLSNAVKYTKIGGNVVTHLRNDDNYYYVSVKDEGMGIPTEE
ncbi:MAG: HAMP domain-containing histidine kinase, partial [Cyclobacteriaceae bacterium]|nr:HAMP domain-containing histidine kinase [Cyclobacteriaceae bacterium]